MIVMISGIAFDRPDGLSHLRAFPYHFKIYTILPLVRIEFNSNFKWSIEVFSFIRVICDCLGSVFIWLSRSSEHYLRHLGQSQHSQNVSMTVLSWADIIREKLYFYYINSYIYDYKRNVIFLGQGKNQESLQLVRKRHRCCEGLWKVSLKVYFLVKSFQKMQGKSF